MQREAPPLARWLHGWLLVLVLVLTALTATPVSAQIVATVKGTVVDGEGNPMVKVPIVLEVVRVEGRAPGVLPKVKTKKNGAFTYPFLSPGEYKVYPALEGYVVVKMAVLSVDSQKNLRMGNPDGSPLEFLISRDQANLPPIPVAPQGQGSVISGKCQVDIVVVKDEDYTQALAALREGETVDDDTGPSAPMVSRKRDAVERGDEYLAGGDYAQAATAFQEALDEDPERSDAAYGLGKAQLRQDDLAGAQSALMTAARLDPELPGVNFYLATIYHSLAQDAAAIAALEKERVLSPDSEEVLVNLGSLYLDASKPKEAMAVLEQVVELNPENTDAFLALANVHNQLGQTQKGEEIYRMIVESNPGQEDVIWYNIGVNAFNNDNRDAAAQAFENSLKANPKNPDAHKMLGYTLVGLGKSEEAIAHFERYLKLEPKGADAEKVTAFLKTLKSG